MRVNMNDSRISNITEIREFLKATKKIRISMEESIEDKYEFIDRTIDRLKYSSLGKRDKKAVKAYITKYTGYKKTQLDFLIGKARRSKLVRKKYDRKNPNKKYDHDDIKLLEYTDEVHLRLNVKATKEILRRENDVFHNKDYENIAKVSESHINNLRKEDSYQFYWINHTKSKERDIGKTKKPDSLGRPGSIRVDSVSQKDIYHINAVDEIIQWEVVISVPRITEFFMRPALKEILDQFPFKIFNFHSDRGGEYINHTTEDLLNSLLIEQTKSRARKTNDNALVESKNAHVIRKNFGWKFISEDQEVVLAINEFYRKYFNPYLNFHRPCLYPKDIQLDNGKIKKEYEECCVPYEKLKKVCKKQKINFLKPGVSFKKYDKIAYELSDNEFANIMRQEKLKLAKFINQKNDSRFSTAV